MRIICIKKYLYLGDSFVESFVESYRATNLNVCRVQIANVMTFTHLGCVGQTAVALSKFRQNYIDKNNIR